VLSEHLGKISDRPLGEFYLGLHLLVLAQERKKFVFAYWLAAHLRD